MGRWYLVRQEAEAGGWAEGLTDACCGTLILDKSGGVDVISKCAANWARRLRTMSRLANPR